MIELEQTDDILRELDGQVVKLIAFQIVLNVQGGSILLAEGVSSLNRAKTLRDGLTRAGSHALAALAGGGGVAGGDGVRGEETDQTLALPQMLAILRMRYTAGRVSYGNALREIRKDREQRKKVA